MNEKEEIRYIDMFGGIGGFRLGIERAENNRCNLQKQTPEGIHKNCSNTKEFQSRKFTCVAYYDNDKYAVQTYNKNFGENHEPTDITTVRTEDIPDFDLLCAGFPCQAFSIAGKRRGFQDTRGTMFFEIARIVKAKRPVYLFLENVKGLLNHEKGQTFSTILQTLDELGYETQWMVLNSKFFGVPQNRERVFIIGNLRSEPRPEILPFGESSQEDSRDIAYCLDSNYWKGTRDIRKKQRTMIHTAYQGAVREYKETSPTIRTSKGGGHLPMVAERVPLRFLERNQKNIEGDYSFTVDSSQNGGVKVNSKIRRLTPIECSFLQGFPADWNKYGVKYLNPETYNKGYGNEKKTNTLKILRTLQETVNQDKREGWRFTEFITFLQKEVLQPRVYEESIQREVARGCFETSRSLESKAINCCDRMFSMWKQEKYRYTPQGQRSIEQLIRKLASSLSELPHKITQKGRWLEQQEPQKQKEEQERTFCLIVPISDTQRYKQLGNAVTVNVIEAIVNKLNPKKKEKKQG